jgi:hypothetical protein
LAQEFLFLSTGFLWLKFSRIAAKKNRDGVPVLSGSRKRGNENPRLIAPPVTSGESGDNDTPADAMNRLERGYGPRAVN